MAEHNPTDSDQANERDLVGKGTMVGWFARNTVAANLLAIILVIGGVAGLMNVKVEVFPELEPNVVTVQVPYPGATPEEVEEGINQRIEEAVDGITGVDTVTSTAAEGSGAVTVEGLNSADMQKLYNDVQTAIDGITAFPEEAEEPVVQRVTIRKQVITVAIHGETGDPYSQERVLRETAEKVRDRIAALPGVSLVELAAVRPYEVSIEVSEDRLRQYNLTFAEVVQAVRRNSLDLPAGQIKTDAGNRLIRSVGQSYGADDFSGIPLFTNPDGTRVTVGEVANVVDGFQDVDLVNRFDGEQAVLVKVFRVGDQNALDIPAAVKEFVRENQDMLPAGISMTPWRDESQILKARLGTLLNSAKYGLLLVLGVLALFLKLRLALWVTIGIPVSFAGAAMLMPGLDYSLNLISAFAFIVVLGIVVDDAIVVGENVYKHHEKPGIDPLTAAIKGAKQVAVPVTFAVLTTICAFLPMFNVPGTDGQIWSVIPGIVVSVLLFSLVESKLILPAHLTYVPVENGAPKSWRDGPALLRPFGLLGAGWGFIQRGFSGALDWFIQRVYQPAVEAMLRFRYATLAASLGTLVLTGAYVQLGYIDQIFFPMVEGDNVIAQLKMPQGTPIQRTSDAVARLELAAREVTREMDEEFGLQEGSLVDHVLATVGAQPFAQEQAMNGGQRGAVFIDGAHLGEINVQMLPAEERPTDASSEDFLNRWRKRIGDIPGASELTYSTAIFAQGADLEVELRHPELETLEAASVELKEAFSRYPGTYDIKDTLQPGKRELVLKVKPEAEILGITQEDLAQQVRSAFYGAEAQRIQRGRHEVKVMVRYPRANRTSVHDLEQLRVRLPDGSEVPMQEVATATWGRSPDSIRRADRSRIVRVSCELDKDNPAASATVMQKDLKDRVLPALMKRYDGMSWQFEGDQKKQAETFQGLGAGLVVVLFLMYVLMAIPFKSYIQPLIIMLAIPFGLVGAVWGHKLMGFPISIMSMFGIVALSGVVVNDSLVMVTFINEKRGGHSEKLVLALVPPFLLTVVLGVLGLPAFLLPLVFLLGLVLMLVVFALGKDSAGGDLQDHDRLIKAVREAGGHRFRPILLTSLTTFAGLTPLMWEPGVQAQFLKPMAVSLAFGVLFATVITLVIVPCAYLVLEDVERILRWAVDRMRWVLGADHPDGGAPTRSHGLGADSAAGASSPGA